LTAAPLYFSMLWCCTNCIVIISSSTVINHTLAASLHCSFLVKNGNDEVTFFGTHCGVLYSWADL